MSFIADMKALRGEDEAPNGFIAAMRKLKGVSKKQRRPVLIPLAIGRIFDGFSGWPPASRN